MTYVNKSKISFLVYYFSTDVGSTMQQRYPAPGQKCMKAETKEYYE